MEVRADGVDFREQESHGLRVTHQGRGNKPALTFRSWRENTEGSGKRQ